MFSDFETQYSRVLSIDTRPIHNKTVTYTKNITHLTCTQTKWTNILLFRGDYKYFIVDGPRLLHANQLRTKPKP